MVVRAHPALGQLGTTRWRHHSIAMTSTGMRPAMDRRTRASYSLRSAPALPDSPHSCSIPAATRQESNLDALLLLGAGDDGTAIAPAGSALLTESTRTAARSLSPTKVGTHLEGVEYRFLARAADNHHAVHQADPVEQAETSAETNSSPFTPKIATTPTTTLHRGANEDVKTRRGRAQDGIDISDDSLGGGQDMQTVSGRPNPGKIEDIESSRERSIAPSSGLGMPGKLMELVEDRDRAVQLCLQYRCKMKDSVQSLRLSERRVSGLKRQLQAASAAGGKTSKLLEEATDKAEAAEEHQVRLEARARQGDRANLSVAEDARTTRLQLTRARKDLRELWLERDELAKLAGAAMQGETRCRKRIKTLEFVVAGLREKLEDMALAEKRVAGTVERAEARAASAEGSERGLRASVGAIKVDFEALVDDLRQRDKKIQQLELERETLAVQSAIFMSTANAAVATKTGATAVHSVGGSRQRPGLPHERKETGTPVGEQKVAEARELCGTPSAVSSPHEENEGVRVDGDDISATAEAKHSTNRLKADKRRASQGEGLRVRADMGRKQSVDNKLDAGTTDLGQKSATAGETQHRDREQHPRSTSMTLPAGGGSRLQRKQLAPPTTVGHRRGSTISYPQRGTRVTLTPASDRSPPEDAVTGDKVEDAPASAGPGSAKRPPDEPSKTEDAQMSAKHPAEAPGPPPPMTQRPGSGDVTGRAPTPPLPCRPSAEAPVAAGNRGEGVVSPSFIERVGSPDRSVAVKGLAATGPAADIDGTEGEDVHENDKQGGPAGPLAAGSFDAAAGKEGPHQLGGGVDTPLHTPTGRRDDSVSGVVPTRLVDGVRVLKYSGRGKPKTKVLWVTPDLSEIFYTNVGRTSNAKQTSRMPLAELRTARGRGKYPELLRAHSDRCFVLLRSDDHARNGPVDEGSGAGAKMSLTTPVGTTSGGWKRWGIGGTPPPSLTHGRRWRGRSASGTERLGFGGLGGMAGRRGQAGGGGGGGGGGRERLRLETESAEERDTLVGEINELVRLAGLRASADDFSYRGRDLFDQWCRSSSVARDVGVAAAGAAAGGESKSASGSNGGGDAPVALVAAESTS